MIIHLVFYLLHCANTKKLIPNAIVACRTLMDRCDLFRCCTTRSQCTCEPVLVGSPVIVYCSSCSFRGDNTGDII